MILILFVASCLIGIYILRQYILRQRLLEQLRTARITPEELKRKLDANEDIAILDLRHPLDFLP
jgi:hypothetical protein